MESSSPSGAASSPMAEVLTPRTKVARMLADIDDEVDNAPTPSPSKRPRTAQGDESAIVTLTNLSPSRPSTQDGTDPVSAAVGAPAERSSESDDSEDDVRRPQGRAARRMLLKNSVSQSRTDSPKSLAQSSLSSPLPQPPDDEDDLYSATPRKEPTRTETEPYSLLEQNSSNGLFVSPTKSINEDSEDELPSNPVGPEEKLAELVAQKRAERLAREAEKKARDKEASSAHQSSDLPDEAIEGSQDPIDPQIEQIMSDATRPSRKASKKALLEMERETQRLARQQALAHQIKVKKKFTTGDLFAKFNFRQPTAIDDSNEQVVEGETTASSAPNSDGVEEATKEPASTPPSSPPTPLDYQKSLVDQGALSKLVPVRQDSIASLVEMDEDGDEMLPDLAEVIKASQRPPQAEDDKQIEAAPIEKKSFNLAKLGKRAVSQEDNSDDDLDILPNMPSHLQAFERTNNVKSEKRLADSRAIQNLRFLSHMNVEDGRQQKKGSRPSVNPQMLDAQLRRQAKEQARQQQLERIEELKAKGIEVQTAEEREKEAEAFENLLEKAKQDAVKLREAEKAARKAAGGEDRMEASDDEDEDAEYVGSDSEDGAETEEDDDNVDERDGEEAMVDDAAEETDADDEDEIEDIEAETDAGTVAESLPEDDDAVGRERQVVEEELIAPAAVRQHKPRKSRVVIDDEDEDEEAFQRIGKSVAEDTNEAADADDPFAAFNFGAAGNNDPLFSPTQAFNATMQTPTQLTQEDSFDVLRRIAPPSIASMPPTLPDLDTHDDGETDQIATDESQIPESQRISFNWETQPPETPVPVHLNRGTSGLTETPGWEPSQDPGLQSPWSVQLRREDTLDSNAEHETQSTLRLRVSESPAPSQTAPRRGRLVRRRATTAEDSEDEEPIVAQSKQLEKSDAFREMARRRKEALSAAERADADKEMREMMDEQAEESEDEYTGLGGDDYVAPETEQDREIIDSSHVEVDERAIAAHFAERERIRNEAETNQLYKDLTTGALKRRMGANAFDLEEDEDEMAARRRQLRQQEEARKRKALLKDSNVATLAEGKQSKGRDAFLKAIADDDEGDEITHLSDGERESAQATQDESQMSQSQKADAQPLQEISGNKRPLVEDDYQSDTRPPAKQRRTAGSVLRRPTSLLEVKESLSFLLEEPTAGDLTGPTIEPSSDPEYDEAMPESIESGSEDEFVAGEAARNNDGGFAPNPVAMEAKIMEPPRLPASQRRTAAKPAVVDRLSLKRVSSASDSAHGRTAWAAGPTTGGFKVPSLLRRATTNTASGANERGVSTPNLSRENSGVKMGGTKRSSLAYQARAEERRAIVEASAKRREENTARIAQLRRNSSALNRGLTGRFE